MQFILKQIMYYSVVSLTADFTLCDMKLYTVFILIIAWSLIIALPIAPHHHHHFEAKNLLYNKPFPITFLSIEHLQAVYFP